MKWLWLCLCLLAPAATLAQEDRFDATVTVWLEGDDATSLPALAELARSGHRMARVLLAQIEFKDRGHSPFRAGLRPAEARALFRRDAGYGGFSQSWLSVEAEDGNRLAQTLLAAREPRPDARLISRLRALGEVQATDYPIRITALYGSRKEKEDLLKSPELLPELRPYLLYLTEPAEPRGDGVAALRHIAPFAADLILADDPETLGLAGILALGYPFGDVRPGNRWRGLVDQWVLTAPAMRPIADLCQSHCPGDPTGCGFAFLALTGGYYEAIRLDTPLETVISQDRFLASPRARLMTLRRAARMRAEAGRDWLASIDEIAGMSQCVADLVAETRASYQ